MARFFDSTQAALHLPTGDVKGGASPMSSPTKKEENTRRKCPEGYELIDGKCIKIEDENKQKDSDMMGEHGGNDGYNYNGAYGTGYGE